MALTLPTISQDPWGATLNAALSEMAHRGFDATDLGYQVWNMPPWDAVDFSSANPVSGTVVMMRMPRIVHPRTLTGVTLYRAVAAAGLTDAYVGLYDSTGTQLAVSANVPGNWGALGMQQTAFTSPYAAATGASVFAAMLFVGATPPKLAAAQGITSSNVNGQTTAATGLWATGPAAQTTLPASITMASRTLISTAFWAGLH